jgi:hypothetical protein
MFHSEMDIFSQFPGKDLNEENDAFSVEAPNIPMAPEGSTGISIRKHWKKWETSWDMNFWEKPILVGGLEHGF